MTRYYYTDPLAAAWMAKHFGMKLSTAPDDGWRVLPPDDLAYVPILCKAIRLYIHPDSLHLLKPQIGDVMMLLEGRLYGKVTHVRDYEDGGLYYVIKNHVGWFADFDNIIQRNGIPFMWPQEEQER